MVLLQEHKRLAAALLFCILAGVTIAYGADSSSRRDAPQPVINTLDWSRRFLLRAIEEQSKSHDAVLETMHELEKQIDAVDTLDPVKREDDLRAMLAWYQAYAEWLQANAADFDSDLSALAADPASAAWPDRYRDIERDYRRRGAQLSEYANQLDKMHAVIALRIADIQRVLDYLSSTAFQDAKKRDQDKSHPEKERSRDRNRDKDTDRNKDEDALFVRYRDITDADIVRMQLEILKLQGLRSHLEAIREMDRLELNWIAGKADDSAALSVLARAIASGEPARISEACSRIIKAYESDAAMLKRAMDDIDRLRNRLPGSGTLGSLDRKEELSSYYDRMKSRYDHHASWLAGQIGAYRADMIELKQYR